MVKINKLLTILGLSTLCSFAAAEYEGECVELDELIGDGDDVHCGSCSVDENGKIIKLELIGDLVTQDAIDKIAKYKTIQELKFLRMGEISNVNLESLKLSEINIYDIRYGRKINRFNGNHVTPDVIKSLKNIDTITIEGYQISQETLDALGTLTKAKNINLVQSGYDENLDFTPLKNAKKLRSLYLDYYNYWKPAPSLDVFPESLCSIKQLKELKIADDFTTIPSCISKLKNLETLEIPSCRLEEIPKELVKLSKLKDLNLYNNALTTLPSWFKDLKIKILKLQGNEFTTIPSVVYNMKKLEHLDLSFNDITKISSNIKNLKNLKNLDLSYNKITNIPSAFNKLVNLEHLDLSNNQIANEMPKAIGKLVNLEHLNLERNSITNLPEFLGQLTKLVYLDLSFNSINDTIPESLNNLTELQEIDLDHNVDIKGKALTNPKLTTCNYNIGINTTKGGICVAENTVCVPYVRYGYDDVISDC